MIGVAPTSVDPGPAAGVDGIVISRGRVLNGGLDEDMLCASSFLPFNGNGYHEKW